MADIFRKKRGDGIPLLLVFGLFGLLKREGNTGLGLNIKGLFQGV